LGGYHSLKLGANASFFSMNQKKDMRMAKEKYKPLQSKLEKANCGEMQLKA